MREAYILSRKHGVASYLLSSDGVFNYYLTPFIPNLTLFCSHAEFSESSAASPFGIGILGDYLYWTDISTNSLHRVQKDGDSEDTKMLHGFTDIGNIVVVQKGELAKRGEEEQRLNR